MRYLPHVSCLLGDKWMISAMIFGHLLTFYAYISIPLVYWRASKRYKSTHHPFVRPIYQWLPAFVFCCALTHGFYLLTLFWGGWWYFAAAIMVILTGLVSAYTAWYVIPLLPKYLEDRESQEETVSKLVNTLKSSSDMKQEWKELGAILTKLDSIGGV